MLHSLYALTPLSFSLWLLLHSCSADLIPGNLSSLFAVWGKCTEENQSNTDLDQDSIQPRMLSLTAEREACRIMFNTWAGFSCSLQTICSLGVVSASSSALLCLSHAGCWLLSHVGSAMPGHEYTS